MPVRTPASARCPRRLIGGDSHRFVRRPAPSPPRPVSRVLGQRAAAAVPGLGSRRGPLRRHHRGRGTHRRGASAAVGGSGRQPGGGGALPGVLARPRLPAGPAGLQCRRSGPARRMRAGIPASLRGDLVTGAASGLCPSSNRQRQTVTGSYCPEGRQMTRKHTRQAGAVLRVPQMAACPCPAKPSRRSGDSPLACSHRAGGGAWLPRLISTPGDTTNHISPTPLRPSRPWRVWLLAARATTKRTRSLNNQFRTCSQEASTMAMICKRPRADDGPPLMGRPMAERSRVRRGPARNQAPNAVGVAGCGSRVLGPPGRETSGASAGCGRPGGES